MKFGEEVRWVTFCRVDGCAWSFCSQFRVSEVLSSGQMFVLVTEGMNGEGLEGCLGVPVLGTCSRFGGLIRTFLGLHR